jgi:hypothetical protein
MKKRGMELAINTLIIIVLGIIVLVALLIVFNNQTGIFTNLIKNLMGKSNVDSLVIGCNNLADGGQTYEYCCVKKDVVLGSGKSDKLSLTCGEMRDRAFGARINNVDCAKLC